MDRKRVLAVALLTTALLSSPPAGAEAVPAADAKRPAAAEPDYAEWNRILATYYSATRGMNYADLKARDSAALRNLQRSLGQVDPGALAPRQQLAYWINLYNISVVALVVDRYPMKSIRDLSTDPFIRLNVFDKKIVPLRHGAISLNTIEHQKIRERFRDPRIHFAINCAAVSCPPIRAEAYVGNRIETQLDDQVRRYVGGPGVRIERDGGRTVVRTTKIMKWFGEDFDRWGGGRVAFLRPYLPPGKARLVDAGRRITMEYDSYDWSLNDWRR